MLGPYPVERSVNAYFRQLLPVKFVTNQLRAQVQIACVEQRFLRAPANELEQEEIGQANTFQYLIYAPATTARLVRSNAFIFVEPRINAGE